jgi:hypothetical protein
MDTTPAAFALAFGIFGVVFLAKWWKYRQMTPGQRNRAQALAEPQLAP